MEKTIKSKDCAKIKVLLPALHETKEQEEMTVRAKRSLISLENCLDIEVDTKRYDTAVAGVWEAFLSKWRGKEYDYLLITANDMEADPCMIDFMVKAMQDNPQAGVCSSHVERDYEKFKQGYGQQVYSGELTQGYSNKDPVCMLLRQGVIEKVGKIDHAFPREFVERDYIRRINLAGYEWIEPREILIYHPDRAGTIGNDYERLQRALRKYKLKWGGDASQEVFRHPYNDLSLDISYVRE